MSLSQQQQRHAQKNCIRRPEGPERQLRFRIGHGRRLSSKFKVQSSKFPTPYQLSGQEFKVQPAFATAAVRQKFNPAVYPHVGPIKKGLPPPGKSA
jgi:hypothetical protein